MPAACLRALPHLPAFWPDRPVVALEPGRLPTAGAVALPAGWRGADRLFRRARAAGLDTVCFAPSPWRPTRFGRREAPPALLVAPVDGTVAPRDLLAAVLGPVVAGAPPAGAAARGEAASLMALLREHRLGGCPGLPDPGPGALGSGAGAARLVLDPCDPARAEAAAAALRAARAEAAGDTVLLARAPDAPDGARPVLPGTHPARLAPWSLLDAAAMLYTADADQTGLLAPAAGIPVRAFAPTPWSGPGSAPWPDATDLFAALAAATRCADPFRRRPCTLPEALELLAAWRAAEAVNRRVAVCVGMSFWKRRRIAATLASARGEPAFRRGAEAALATARRRGGGIAVWATRMPPGLPERAAAAGIPVFRVEDGFVRSAGLGAGFLPGASVVLDSSGVHYDPSGPSDLETLLATADFSPALLARAAALRGALRTRQITKYNLSGTLPDLAPPPGERVILVPGQVEDDAAIRQGGGAIRGNLALLRAVRAGNPDACILYKPHPDVEAGHRPGHIPAAEAARLADRVLDRAPIAPLLDRIDELHTMSSLSGFEALLRGRRVVTHGLPFYAGWGLTEDRAPAGSLPRRGRQLTLDQLVAGTLILYPRYTDPVTELPCGVEVLLDRLGDSAAWQPGAVARLRRWQGQLRRAWTLRRS